MVRVGRLARAVKRATSATGATEWVIAPAGCVQGGGKGGERVATIRLFLKAAVKGVVLRPLRGAARLPLLHLLLQLTHVCLAVGPRGIEETWTAGGGVRRGVWRGKRSRNASLLLLRSRALVFRCLGARAANDAPAARRPARYVRHHADLAARAGATPLWRDLLDHLIADAGKKAAAEQRRVLTQVQGKQFCGVVFQRPALPRLLMLFVLLALQTLLLEAPLLVKLLPLLPLRLDAPPLLGLGPAKHGRPVQ